MGVAIAAPLAGIFLDRANYQTPLFIAAGSILAAGLLNNLFFNRMETKTMEMERQEHGYEVESS